MKDTLVEVETLFKEFTADANKLVSSGNKSAGTRSRVVISRITAALKKWRQVSNKAE